MKKKLVKSILAATLAAVTLVSVPQASFLGAKSDNTITAHAACSHNYRHYGTWAEWVTISDYIHPYLQIRIRVQRRKMYSTCVGCGAMDPNTVLNVQTRTIYGD